MFDGWTKPRFYTKCKSALRHTRTRLDPIRKKRVAVERFLKKDIADLLKDGLDYNAYLRADMLLVEQNMTACFDMVEQFCAYISNHLSDMQSEGECPIECREAAASLAYAAARFADLPDLRQLRTLFTQRYGNCFHYFASKEFVERLESGPPTKDVKLKLLQDMAQELSVEWDPKALEQKLFATPNPNMDSHKLDLSTRDEQCNRSSSSSIENERPSRNAKPRSVRRTRKPLSDDNDNVGPRDEEERVLDKLLLHYSTKRSIRDEGEVKMALEENVRPRTASKSMRASEQDRLGAKSHGRSSSIELGGHVHPRMPDYDELAARIAALRGT